MKDNLIIALEEEITAIINYRRLGFLELNDSIRKLSALGNRYHDMIHGMLEFKLIANNRYVEYSVKASHMIEDAIIRAIEVR